MSTQNAGDVLFQRLRKAGPLSTGNDGPPAEPLPIPFAQPIGTQGHILLPSGFWQPPEHREMLWHDCRKGYCTRERNCRFRLPSRDAAAGCASLSGKAAGKCSRGQSYVRYNAERKNAAGITEAAALDHPVWGAIHFIIWSDGYDGAVVDEDAVGADLAGDDPGAAAAGHKSKAFVLSQLDDWLHRGDDPIVRDMNLYVRKYGAKAEKRPANLVFIEPQLSSTFGFRRHKMRLF
jgi:hypothetical protein